VVPLPHPDAPPEIQLSELKPIEPPPPQVRPPTPPKPPVEAPAQRPKPAPAAQSKAPPSQVTQTQSPPDQGADQKTQQAAAASDASLFRGFAMSDGRPRFRLPPRPADYPPRALELGQQGEALVRVRLDPDGKAAEVLLWRGSGFDMLDRAALAAVRGWHFMPALRNGQPVAAWVEIPVRFVHHTR
jgi:protein TonB